MYEKIRKSFCRFECAKNYVVKIHWGKLSLLFLLGISSDEQFLAFTGHSNGQVNVTASCCNRPTTVFLLTRENGRNDAASLVEALMVQLTLIGVLGKL